MKVSKVKIYDLDECISASKYPMSTYPEDCDYSITDTVKALAQSNKGEGHDQFLTGIRVNFDLTCTNQMWKEISRYRFVEFVSGQSTIHRISLFDIKQQCNKYVWNSTMDKLQDKCKGYNYLKEYQKTLINNSDTHLKEQIDANKNRLKELYLEILYNTPTGFELTMRLTTNYRALKTVYSQRKNHPLPEWREFCKWILTLPCAYFIVGEDINKLKYLK